MNKSKVESSTFSVYQLFIKKDDEHSDKVLKLLYEKPGYKEAVTIVYVDAYIEHKKKQNNDKDNNNNGENNDNIKENENSENSETKETIKLCREFFRRLNASRIPPGVPALVHKESGKIEIGEQVLITFRNADFWSDLYHIVLSKLIKLQDLYTSLLQQGQIKIKSVPTASPSSTPTYGSSANNYESLSSYGPNVNIPVSSSIHNYRKKPIIKNFTDPQHIQQNYRHHQQPIASSYSSYSMPINSFIHNANIHSSNNHNSRSHYPQQNYENDIDDLEDIEETIEAQKISAAIQARNSYEESVQKNYIHPPHYSNNQNNNNNYNDQYVDESLPLFTKESFSSTNYKQNHQQIPDYDASPLMNYQQLAEQTPITKTQKHSTPLKKSIEIPDFISMFKPTE